MVCQRWALAPIVALVITGLGGSAASSALAAPRASDSGATAIAAAKRKAPTLRALDARLRKAEQNLTGARRQLKALQTAASALITGLNGGSLGGASGAPLGSDLSALAGLDLDKLQQDIIAASAARQLPTAPQASLFDQLADPATQGAFISFLTNAFGMSPVLLGQTIAQLAPQLTGGLAGLTVREEPVVVVKLGGTVAAAVHGSDLSDDLNPQSVTGSIAVQVPNGTSAVPIQLLAGVRSAEADTPAAKVQLDTLEVEPLGSGVTVAGGSGSGLPIKGSGQLAISGSSVLARTAPASAEPALDLGSTGIASIVGGPTATPLTATNTSGSAKVVMVRFTARFVDDSTGD